MATQNNAPAGGMRDFLPVEAGRRQAVIHTIQEVYRTWGFLPLETPALERLATLQGKYGEEGENLMYKVLKRGAKLDRALASDPRPDDLADMGLRYDLTVPLARVMAAHQADLPAIFKRYQIQSVFRADRPARGRYREFSQCDVDIVGVAGVDAEADVLGAAAESLHRLGFKQPDDFTLRLNHRQVLAGLLARAGIPEHLAGEAMVAVDKADKIGLDGVRRELAERGIAPAAGDTFLTMAADMSEVASTEALLTVLADWLGDSGPAGEGVADLKQLTDLLEAGPAAGRYRIDPLLARGLGYYTGAIYEVQFPDFSRFRRRWRTLRRSPGYVLRPFGASLWIQLWSRTGTSDNGRARHVRSRDGTRPTGIGGPDGSGGRRPRTPRGEPVEASRPAYGPVSVSRPSGPAVPVRREPRDPLRGPGRRQRGRGWPVVGQGPGNR